MSSRKQGCFNDTQRGEEGGSVAPINVSATLDNIRELYINKAVASDTVDACVTRAFVYFRLLSPAALTWCSKPAEATETNYNKLENWLTKALIFDVACVSINR